MVWLKTITMYYDRTRHRSSEFSTSPTFSQLKRSIYPAPYFKTFSPPDYAERQRISNRCGQCYKPTWSISMHPTEMKTCFQVPFLIIYLQCHPIPHRISIHFKSISVRLPPLQYYATTSTKLPRFITSTTQSKINLWTWLFSFPKTLNLSLLLPIWKIGMTRPRMLSPTQISSKSPRAWRIEVYMSITSNCKWLICVSPCVVCLSLSQSLLWSVAQWRGVRETAEGVKENLNLDMVWYVWFVCCFSIEHGLYALRVSCASSKSTVCLGLRWCLRCPW